MGSFDIRGGDTLYLSLTHKSEDLKAFMVRVWYRQGSLAITWSKSQFMRGQVGVIGIISCISVMYNLKPLNPEP